MISVIMTGQLSVDNTAGAETSRCRDTCVTRDLDLNKPRSLFYLSTRRGGEAKQSLQLIKPCERRNNHIHHCGYIITAEHNQTV